MSRKEELLKVVALNHEWADGQTYSNGGTSFYCTDVCEICGLHRHWHTDWQNGVEDRYAFSTFDGESLTLSQAANQPCD